MTARFATTGQQANLSSSYKSVLGLTGGTGGRLWVYDMMFGAGGTPADNALVWRAMRHTAAGTSTAVTPERLDTADAAAAAAGGENHTVEPTTSGIPIIELPLNQRASYRWVAAPGGEIVVPATSGNGVAIAAKSAGYTGTAEATAMHAE